MPMDKSGKFRPNPQLARRADRMAGHGGGDSPAPGGSSSGESIMQTTLHDNGDGTFRTDGDGGSADHPSLGHALMSMAAKHALGDKHMHVGHDGSRITTHSADEDGNVSGPDDHADGDAAADHVRATMDGGDSGEVPTDSDEDGYSEDLEYGE